MYEYEHVESVLIDVTVCVCVCVGLHVYMYVPRVHTFTENAIPNVHIIYWELMVRLTNG